MHIFLLLLYRFLNFVIFRPLFALTVDQLIKVVSALLQLAG